jgi:hypothetical protein
MADKALSFPQHLVVILRGPTGGMLACLLTASLLGGVAAAHPDAWADPARAGQQAGQSDGRQEATAPQTVALGATTCGVVLLGLAAADDLHALTRAIRSVRTNCEGVPQAPGLLIALRHLRANLERQGSSAGGGNVPGGSGASGAPSGHGASGAGSNAGGPGSNAGGGQAAEGGANGGSGSGSNAGHGNTASGSGSGDSGSGWGSGSGSNPGGGNGGSGPNGQPHPGHGVGQGASGENDGPASGSGAPSGGGSPSGDRHATPNHH